MASEQDVRLPLHVTSKQISVFAETRTLRELKRLQDSVRHMVPRQRYIWEMLEIMTSISSRESFQFQL